MAKNILNDLKNIRNNEVAVTTVISFLKEFVKRKFNEVISIHDQKLRADELVRDKDFTPRMLDADTKTLQYSIAGALVTANVGGNANALSVEAGSFIDHSFYAKDRKTIAAIKAIPEVYDPSRSWVVSATNLTIANNNGHWLYLKVPTAAGVTSSELFASESHIDPLRDVGYIILKWGYVHPVVNGSREVSMLWNNVKGGDGVAQIQSDWNQADNTKKDFIKNKPAIPAAGLTDAPSDGKLYGRKNGAWTEVIIPSDNSVVVRIDFQDLTACTYTCPVALKFTSQESEGTAATLSVGLNTNMVKYQDLIVTPTVTGLIILTGVQL